MCPFSGEASCPAQDEAREMRRIENICKIGYVVLTTLEILTLGVASIASQIHDWFLLAAAISAFMLLVRVNYRWTRGRP